MGAPLGGAPAPGRAPSAPSKEPVLSPRPRHRAPGTAPVASRFGRARHALRASHQRGLFVVTALVCAGLLIAVPLALLFSGSGGPGSRGQGGSGSGGTRGPGGGAPVTLTPTASLTSAPGQPGAGEPGAQQPGTAQGAGQVPGPGGAGPAAFAGGPAGGSGGPGAQPGGTAGGVPAGNPSGGSGSTSPGGGGQPTRTSSPTSSCICSTLAPIVSSATSALPLPLPSAPTLP